MSEIPGGAEEHEHRRSGYQAVVGHRTSRVMGRVRPAGRYGSYPGTSPGPHTAICPGPPPPAGLGGEAVSPQKVPLLVVHLGGEPREPAGVVGQVQRPGPQGRGRSGQEG